ncbi:MAG TPA: hypothetical protein VN663_22940 [Ramlibacter sp.]|nr:hypothetical protein [Ramlibacter sp.]
MSDLATRDEPPSVPSAIPPGPSGFANAMGAGPTPGEIAKVKGESAAHQEKLKAAGDELVKSTEASNAARHALMLQKPPMPPPQPAPTMQNTNPVEAWGSLAMSMAMLGSAFTKRPLLNSLNAAADVMKAYQAKDASAYKTAFDKWKAESDYSLKLYEYQHESYKDALDMIATDSKGALALFNAKAVALGDSPMEQFAKGEKLTEAVALANERKARTDQMITQTAAARRTGEVNQEVLDAGNALRENPNDPEAQLRYKNARAAQHDLASNASAANAPEFHASKEFVIRDAQGKEVERVMGRESMRGENKIVRTDNNQPIQLQPGQTIHSAPPGSEGRQAASQANRLIGATSELAASLKNLVELPIDSNAGAFMGLQSIQPDSLKAAIGRVAATHLVGEQALAVTQQFTGLQRQLATIESQGAAQGLVGLTTANNVLVPQKGWSGTAVMRSYAEIRQIAEANIRAMLSSDAVKEPQKELLRNLQKEIEKAVPYSVHDVNQLAFGGKKKFKESVNTFAERMLARREADSEKPSPVPSSPSPATTAPAGQPSAPPPVPEALKGMTLKGWSPSTQRFYDDAGKAYDKNGAPAQ